MAAQQHKDSGDFSFTAASKTVQVEEVQPLSTTTNAIPEHVQVLGHSKTVCVLLGGWAFLGDQISFKQLMGMLVAVTGMILYGFATYALLLLLSIQQFLLEQETPTLQSKTCSAGLVCHHLQAFAPVAPSSEPSTSQQTARSSMTHCVYAWQTSTCTPFAKITTQDLILPGKGPRTYIYVLILLTGGSYSTVV